MRISDWSSDVGSSDLHVDVALGDFDGLVDEDDAHLGAHDALRLVEAAHDDAGAVVVAERRGLSRTAPVEVHEACLDGLDSHLVTEGGQCGAGEGPGDLADAAGARAGVIEADPESGRASSQDMVCPSVYVPVVEVAL